MNLGIYHKGCGLSAALLLLTQAAVAEWTTDAAVSAGVYYSDNICLSSLDEEGKAVGTLTPSLSLRGTGGRSTTSLDAAVEYNSLGDSSLECPLGGNVNVANREALVPRINFFHELEAVSDLIFLEADAYAAQNALNPFAAGGDDNLNGTGNVNITYRWGLGARLERRLSEEWGVFARYNYNEQYNSFNQVLGDSNESTFNFDIGKIPGVSRYSYGLRGQYSEVEFEETDLQPEFTNRLARAEVRGAVQVTRSFQLNGYAGEEDNVFVSESDEIDGSFWDIGVRWTPNARVSFDAGYGERFFGEAPRLSASYRHKRSLLTFSYLRDIRFPRNIRASDSGFDEGNDVPEAPGDALGSGGDPTFLGQSPVIDERFNLSFRYEGVRTILTVTASDSNQTRAADGVRGEFTNAGVSLTRRLARNLRASAGVDWRDSNADQLSVGFGGFQDAEAWRATVGLSRDLSVLTTANVRYRYVDQTSDLNRNNFKESRIELSMTHRF